MTKSKRHYWTKEQDIILLDRFPNEPTKVLAEFFGLPYHKVVGRANRLGLKKSSEFLNSDLSGRGNLKGGKAFRFKKGDKPWNFGTKGLTGANKTSFKKGNIPHNTRSDGEISIRPDKSGRNYKYIRVCLGKWELYHRYLWEQNNGKIPKGYIVAFKDGDSMNCVIENLELISREQNMARNTIHHYPNEVKSVIRKISKLKKTIKNAEEQT